MHNASIDLQTEEFLEGFDSDSSIYKGLSLDLDLLWSVMRVNERRAFTTLDRSIQMFQGAGKAHSGVFGLTTLLNHDCAPNCRWFFLGDIMFVQAIEAIDPGDELTRQFVPALQEFSLLPDRVLYRGDKSDFSVMDSSPLMSKLMSVKPKTPVKGPKPKPRKVSNDSMLTRYYGFECCCPFHEAVQSNATAWVRMRKMLCDAVDMHINHNLDKQWEGLANEMENLTKPMEEMLGGPNPIQFRYLNVLADAAKKTAHWNEGLFLRGEAFETCPIECRYAWMFDPDPIMRLCQFFNERMWLVSRQKRLYSVDGMKEEFEVLKQQLLSYCLGSEVLARRMYPVATPENQGEKLTW
jgi:hypothetical protein